MIATISLMNMAARTPPPMPGTRQFLLLWSPALTTPPLLDLVLSDTQPCDAVAQRRRLLKQWLKLVPSGSRPFALRLCHLLLRRGREAMHGVSHPAPGMLGVNASPQGVPSPGAPTRSEAKSAVVEAPMSFQGLQGVRSRAALWACVERDLRVCGLFPAGNHAE